MRCLPSPEGVAQLKGLLIEYRKQDRRIAEASKWLKVLEDAKEKRDVAFKATTELLQAMDCHTSHNYGWEGRITWMLCELLYQTQEAANANFNQRTEETTGSQEQAEPGQGEQG